jgi:hypothetical protein
MIITVAWEASPPPERPDIHILIAEVRAALARSEEALLDHDIVVDDLRHELVAVVERLRGAVRERHRAAAHRECLRAWLAEAEAL